SAKLHIVIHSLLILPYISQISSGSCALVGPLEQISSEFVKHSKTNDLKLSGLKKKYYQL
ncbi:MAG: hypothetical protein ACJ71J_02790, partial [Nitrososphaeraceae archaeon]